MNHKEINPRLTKAGKFLLETSGRKNLEEKFGDYEQLEKDVKGVVKKLVYEKKKAIV